MRRSLSIAAPLLVSLCLFAGACSKGEVVGTGSSAPAGVAATPAGGSSGTGGYAPTTAPVVDLSRLPASARKAADVAGADEQERACVNARLVEDMAGDPKAAHRPEAVAGSAGHALLECLPPAKLAAATVEKLQAGPLGASLRPEQVNCVRGALATGDAAPYVLFIGGLAVDDPAVARPGAVGLDAACGTSLATPF